MIHLGAQWNDEAVFTCQTEDGESTSAKLCVTVQERKQTRKVQKPKLYGIKL